MKTKNNNEVIQLLSGRSNVFLIRGKNGGKIIVDTSIKLVRKMLRAELRRYNSLDASYLILTHHHFDHTANAGWLRRETGLKTIIHSEEAEYLQSGKTKIPEGTYSFTKGLVSLAGSINLDIKSEPCPADIITGDRFDIPEFEGIYTIHTPGHSKGSNSVIIDEEIAIVGDAMINVGFFKVMPPFADDIDALRKSWDRLLDTGCQIFLPSHGSAIKRYELANYVQKVKAQK